MEQTLYEMASTTTIKTNEFVDISEYLYDILNAQKLNIALTFKTHKPKKMCLFSLCYREALLPAFAILLWKGYVVLVRSSSSHAYDVIESDISYCDDVQHDVLLQWNGEDMKVYVDQVLIMHEETVKLFEYRYINSVFLGKCFYADDDLLYFDGIVKNIRISCEEVESSNHSKALAEQDHIEKDFISRNKLTSAEQMEDSPAQCIFQHEAEGCCNYRIPSILTTKKGNLIATVDARIDCPGDNPNHIARAVSISKDAGTTWSEIKIFHDHGGKGRRTGASSIDAVMVQDRYTERIFMLYSHTSQLVGSYNSAAGIGFHSNGKKQLFDTDERVFSVESDGAIVGMDGIKTDCILRQDIVYKGDRTIGNIQHDTCQFHQKNTTFLKICYSDDEGESWSEAMDLNLIIKEPWMRFIGSCPGQGIQIHDGRYKGRLLLPVYYANEHHKYSFAALYSDDHGVTWQRGNSVNDDRIVHGVKLHSKTIDNDMFMTTETSLLVLTDGSIKAFMRNYCGEPYVLSAISKDGGVHFHDRKVETQLLDPNCQNTALRVLYRGQILYFFCNPSDMKVRRNGVLKVSIDNANTWKDAAVITCGDFGYSCLCMCDEETIGILYEGKDVSIYFKKYKIADVLQVII